MHLWSLHVNRLMNVSVCVLVWQVCSAVVAGTAGCVGTTLQQEATPPRTALITSLTLTPQVSSDTASRDEFTSNRLLAVSENLVVLSEKATKYCGEDGRWFHHPEADRIWTNYTLCASGHEKRLRVTICPSLLNLQGQDINQIILYQ